MAEDVVLIAILPTIVDITVVALDMFTLLLLRQIIRLDVY